MSRYHKICNNCQRIFHEDEAFVYCKCLAENGFVKYWCSDICAKEEGFEFINCEKECDSCEFEGDCDDEKDKVRQCKFCKPKANCCEGRECMSCNNYDWSCNACNVDVNFNCGCERCKIRDEKISHNHVYEKFCEMLETDEEYKRSFKDNIAIAIQDVFKQQNTIISNKALYNLSNLSANEFIKRFTHNYKKENGYDEEI